MGIDSCSQDLASIQQLMARYTICGDRRDIPGLAATFAQDGTLEIAGELACGRDAIVARLQRPGRHNPDLRLCRHHLTTSLIEIDGDRGSARSYFHVLTNIGLDHHGHYVDRIVREDDGWRFEHRSVRIDWQSSDSLFPPFPPRP